MPKQYIHQNKVFCWRDTTFALVVLRVVLVCISLHEYNGINIIELFPKKI